MRLDRFYYFFDFAFCPPLIVYFLYLACRGWEALDLLTIGFWIVTALGLWTFIEYLTHRWLFHHAPILRHMHAAHHDAPDQLVASPPGSFPLILIALAYGALFHFSPAASAAVAAGLLIGYLLYSFIHSATHLWPDLRSPYFPVLRQRHLLHHFGRADVNFGVTTGFWDYVFATSYKPGVQSARRRFSS